MSQGISMRMTHNCNQRDYKVYISSRFILELTMLSQEQGLISCANQYI